MKTYYIYITDLFCGDLNYSYITRFTVKANTDKGAVGKVARETGLRFRNYMDEIYHSTSRLTGLVIEGDSDSGDLHLVEALQDQYQNSFLI